MTDAADLLARLRARADFLYSMDLLLPEDIGLMRDAAATIEQITTALATAERERDYYRTKSADQEHDAIRRVAHLNTNVQRADRAERERDDALTRLRTTQLHLDEQSTNVADLSEDIEGMRHSLRATEARIWREAASDALTVGEKSRTHETDTLIMELVADFEHRATQAETKG